MHVNKQAKSTVNSTRSDTKNKYKYIDHHEIYKWIKFTY